ncbi:prepilin-type N-terminal cleavage/methylation domain-containing protein [Thalassotalea crassostreae]|uniref:prepilin-type N-terminal cleavage/methylation domain-containing protein n=1 Tax=Thalassotalea crassostreae TaxID=1763536 RepID=UPI000838D0F0|nr:prepilin-type N-terminal cleavage/methylation domain-containing protein [Thalassotalea crassostreae]
MKNLNGFTLIELTIVVVVLAVLSVVAAPKFIDLPRDTRIAHLESFAGTLTEANNIVFSKTFIKNLHLESDIPASDIDPEFFVYPEARLAFGQAQSCTNSILAHIDTDNYDYSYYGAEKCINEYYAKDPDDPENIGEVPFLRIYPQGWLNSNRTDVKCYVEYTQAFKLDGEIIPAFVSVKTEEC